MSSYVLLLGIACVVNAVAAGAIASRTWERTESRVIAAMHLGAAWWALCEVLWNLAPDAETAIFWVRASSPGWLFIGSLVLHAFVALDGGRSPVRRVIPLAYAASGGMVLWTLFGTQLMVEAVPTRWGYGYRVGNVYAFSYFVIVAPVLVGFSVLRGLVDRATTDADRRQLPFVVVGLGIPLLLASTTDVVLPLFDIQVPRLGTTSFAILGLLTLYSTIRFGFSFVVPSNFSEAILATLSDGVALLHPNGKIRSANQGLARLAGISRDRLERMTIQELVSPDLESLGHEVRDLEGTLHGVKRQPVAITSRPVRDRQGNALGIVVSLHDLREVEALRTRLVTSDRLAAVGQLAAGIAHEINNPLAFVRANLSHLESQWKQLRAPLQGDEPLPDHVLRELVLETDEVIEESLEGVDRATEIIRGIRGFSHAGAPEQADADVNELVEQALLVAGPRLRGRVAVERRFGALPVLRCAGQQLKQVFLNLILNAEQAQVDGGTIRLTTRARDGAVEVDVEDDGPGIPESIRERIFDPFFTTKAVGEGTGLGLGICHEIVRAHGGRIEVGTPERGARLRVWLPLVRSISRN